MNTSEPSTMAGGLLDISELPLRELWTLDDSALSQALRRVLESADQGPTEAVSAFNSGL